MNSTFRFIFTHVEFVYIQKIKISSTRKMEGLNCTPGFCPNCGSIFPQLRQNGNVICYTCKDEFKPESKYNFGKSRSHISTFFSVFGTQEYEYTIHFNDYEKRIGPKVKKEEESEDEGPVIDRRCSACGNNKMSYATLQLRSADEGQTVFFTCTKCK